MTLFQLGNTSDEGGRSDFVRDDAFEFVSRRGLNAATAFLIDQHRGERQALQA